MTPRILEAIEEQNRKNEWLGHVTLAPMTVQMPLCYAFELTACVMSSPEYHFSMSVEEIKKGLIALSEAEQSEVTAFLFHLRHSRDPDYQDVVSARLSDSDSSHWVTPEEFEKRLNQR